MRMSAGTIALIGMNGSNCFTKMEKNGIIHKEVLKILWMRQEENEQNN